MIATVVLGRRDRTCDACRAPIHARVRYVRVTDLTTWRYYPHGVRYTGALCVRCGSRAVERPIRAALAEARIVA